MPTPDYTFDPACPRIDAHTHARSFSDIKYRGSGSAYVKRLRKQGIHAIALLAPGETCKKAADKFGDFIIPVPMYRLKTLGGVDIRKDMARWLDWGCKAIKFIAPLRPYSDELYWPLYQELLDRNATAMFHTGFLGHGGEPEIPPVEMTHMRAAHVDTIARRFPTLRIIMSHFSNPWWEEAWKVSWTRPNVYADLSGHTAIFRSMSMWAETFAPNGQLMEASLAKLLFASDEGYLHSDEHKFPAWAEFYQKLMDRINAPQRLRKLVWAGNAKRLFGIA